jgi:hypothetical protein
VGSDTGWVGGGRVAVIPNRQSHEPTDACGRIHCFAHMVDEPGPGYLACGECGHMYKTKRELRREHRRIYWSEIRTRQFTWLPSRRVKTDVWYQAVLSQVGDGSPGTAHLFGPPKIWRLLWVVATVRAGRICTCPHCTHDF